MKEIYDLLVIGGGPAGLSTGIYAGRVKLNTLIIEKEELDGDIKIIKASKGELKGRAIYIVI